MDVLGYGEWGDQKRFAQDIGVAHVNFNKICKGSPLSIKVETAIFKQFYPRISYEFLRHGLSGYGQHRFEEQLREWERRTGRRIFVSFPAAS